MADAKDRLDILQGRMEAFMLVFNASMVLHLKSSPDTLDPLIAAYDTYEIFNAIDQPSSKVTVETTGRG